MTANARLRSVVHVLTSFITTLLANIFGDFLGASHEVRRFLQFATVRKRHGCTDYKRILVASTRSLHKPSTDGRVGM
jgi:hypothetical protein